MSFDPEYVDLDPSAVKAISDSVVSAIRNAPERAPLTKGGIQPKPGQSTFYGGHDLYTAAGRDDAELVVNLSLAKAILRTCSPTTWKGDPRISDRLEAVLLGAAERYISAGTSADISAHADPDGFVVKTYRGLRADARTKAMTSTGAGAGDEWVPTLAAADLWRDMHLATLVAGQIPRVEMPSNPYTLPTMTADPTFYYASTENVAVTASNPTTASATLTAKKIQAEVDFSGEVTEDSIIPVVPALRAALTRRGAQTIDDLIVSGDTTTGGTGNVNSDDAARTANSADLALDGLRKFCITTNTAQKKDFSGAPTTTLYLNTRSLLGRYGARPSDLVCIMPTTTSFAFQDVSGFKSIADFGPQATVVTGQLGSIFGTVVVGYEAIPGSTTDKVDADGKYTTTTPASNDTKGWFVLVNKSQWTQGFRRGLTIESFRDIQKDQNILVASFRMALIPSGIATTHTAVGYNITLL